MTPRSGTITELPRDDIAQWFAVLAQAITSQPDTDTSASRRLDLLVKASGSEWAAIAHLKGHGGLFFDYSTDASLIAQVVAIAVTTDQGIASQALHTSGAIRDAVGEFAAVYTDHLAIALANARDQDRSANLGKALLSNRETESVRVRHLTKSALQVNSLRNAIGKR
ncbi:MAG: hypothetical protein JWN47_2234 [Frankiales bacterium]|nr:hypothetical protein [Frankiales bacterium]